MPVRRPAWTPPPGLLKAFVDLGRHGPSPDRLRLVADHDETTGLPVGVYGGDEVKALAEVVYLHVYEPYETAANNVYAVGGDEGVLA